VSVRHRFSSNRSCLRGGTGELALAETAELAAQELGWNTGRRTVEVEQVKQRFIPGCKLTPPM